MLFDCFSGGSLAKIVEQRAIKVRSNIFIVDKFGKKLTYNIGGFKKGEKDHM